MELLDIIIRMLRQQIVEGSVAMKMEYQIKKKPANILSNEEKSMLLNVYGLIKRGKDEQIDLYEVKKFPLFHMEFTDMKNTYSSNVVKLFLTDELKVYQLDLEFEKERGVLRIKDSGDSFATIITKKPFIFGGANDVFEPVEIEYNPKAIW